MDPSKGCSIMKEKPKMITTILRKIRIHKATYDARAVFILSLIDIANVLILFRKL